MIGTLLVSFYNLWHGILGLKGGGVLLRRLSPCLKALQQYPVTLDDGQIIHLDFRDASAFAWINDRLAEPYEESGLVKAILNLGLDQAVFWDIGSNCGMLSYKLIRESNVKQMVLFDPNPAMYGLSSEVMAPFSNVLCQNVALSSEPGRMELLIEPGQSFKGRLGDRSGAGTSEVHEVDVISADMVIDQEGLMPPDVIKIDAEGHELKVFEGLVGIIGKYRPIIFFENIELTREEIEGITPPDYSVSTVSDVSGKLDTGTSPRVGHNSVFIPDERQRNL